MPEIPSHSADPRLRRLSDSTRSWHGKPGELDMSPGGIGHAESHTWPVRSPGRKPALTGKLPCLILTPVDQPDVKITVNGRPAITAAEIARRAGIEPSAVHSFIRRSGLQDVARLGYAYDEEQVDQVLANRPGRGAPGRPKPLRIPHAE
jgi:hypothetical protein